MHYYKFNIADYRKDTAHLNAMEHYIYRQLIDWCYLDECGIPKKTQTVMRRLSLGKENEASLLNVLEDFFFETEDSWNHKKIDAGITEYHAKAEKNKENGKKGGRPKAQQKQGCEGISKPKITQSVKNANPVESESKPNHKPITNNHKPITNKEKKKTARFQPPSVTELINEFGDRVSDPIGEADSFYNFYESKGWMVGKNKMKSWPHAVTNWVGRMEHKFPPKPPDKQLAIANTVDRMTDRSWAE